MKTAFRYLIVFFCVILATLLLSGCKSVESYYRGYLSTNQSSFDLVDNSKRQGSWETFDLKLDYQTEMKGEILDVSGMVTFGNYYAMNSAQIVVFDAYLFWLDEDAKVLGTTRLARSVSVQGSDPIRFSESLRVPAGTKALSFGYSGESQGDGGYERGGGGGLEAFESLPKKPVNAKRKDSLFPLSIWFLAFLAS